MLVVTSSNYPVPTVCKFDQTNDWFRGLAGCLHWNDRPTANHDFCVGEDQAGGGAGW